MGRLTEAVLRSQQISVAAKEEASRWHHPRIDVEHLLLALLVTPGAAGGVLRSLGVTLESARAAVERTHAARVTGLGVDVPELTAAPPSDPAVGPTLWTPRAEAVMRAVTDDGDDLGHLRALVTEPSGSVQDVLHELDLDAERVLAAADGRRTTTPLPTTRPAAPRRGWDTVTHDAFVPAPRTDVWALVRDPERLPAWDRTVTSVEPVGDGAWAVLLAPTRTTIARRTRSPEQSRLGLHVVEQSPGRAVTWRWSWGTPRGTVRQELELELDDVEGGTALRAVARWRRATGPVARLRAPLRPLRRFVMRQRLLATTGGISRALR
ncbi:Clp protease N-terminal domain-containing protein [Cellulomonas sp. B6]|uniref:Clp protease N-terminal domain-containing protein n=1 Tax=Cellulomonas sp. B6 TaxID=1295626 RepID=UPI00073BCACD|nr:Clp protease N-terminal domain-containing protein [Cellulomonas sp. B6]KSW30108.1 hypothetical protein ATM99_04730 [Cellulomonas sp. B6]